MPENSLRGVLHAYDPIKGYGFVHREQGKDVYVHYSEFTGATGDSGVSVGTVIQYDVVEGAGQRPRAKNVTVIS